VSEIITIPAGVILPKELLMWLRDCRTEAGQEYDEWVDQDGHDSWEAAICEGRRQAFSEIIQHISFGVAP
jgi:hypothetical protein